MGERASARLEVASALGRAIQVLFRICEHCARAQTCGDGVEVKKYRVSRRRYGMVWCPLTRFTVWCSQYLLRLTDIARQTVDISNIL